MTWTPCCPGRTLKVLDQRASDPLAVPVSAHKEAAQPFFSASQHAYDLAVVLGDKDHLGADHLCDGGLVCGLG